METIAIIDDDIYIGDMLEKVLQKEGYQTMRAYSGTEALMLLERKKPDLMLLDLMLPGLSGEEVLEAAGSLPIIVISAKADISDKVNLLLHGANDYLTKPFDIQELLARIAVQFRRQQLAQANQLLRYEDLEIETDLHELRVSGTPVKATRTEFAILKLLMQNPSQVVTRSVLLERLSMDTPDCTENSLNVHVSHLRKKLKAVNGTDYIEAVWGIGFKLKAKDLES